RDLSPRPSLLRAHFVPDQAAALRYDARKLSLARLASDDRKRDTLQSLNLHGVGRHRPDRTGTTVLHSANGDRLEAVQMTLPDYDVVVVGTGPGGRSAAYARAHGGLS